MIAWLRWLVGMDWEPRETAWAIRELQQRAADDPELKPAKVLYKRAHPRKVVIGEFQARLLRMRRRA